MTHKETFIDVVERFKISTAKINEAGITSEEATTACKRFMKAFGQAKFQESIDQKFPDTTKFKGDTLEIPVENLPPANGIGVAGYRYAVFFKENDRWQFSHFTPDI